jgi:hypothetical protein
MRENDTHSTKTNRQSGMHKKIVQPSNKRDVAIGTCDVKSRATSVYSVEESVTMSLMMQMMLTMLMMVLMMMTVVFSLPVR